MFIRSGLLAILVLLAALGSFGHRPASIVQDGIEMRFLPPATAHRPSRGVGRSGAVKLMRESG
jgi:hypothetical protein